MIGIVWGKMAGTTRLELATSGVTEAWKNKEFR
jgi:hypothetical protein